MKRTKIKIDTEMFPYDISAFLKGADIYDSSCSKESRVYYIDKGKGYYLKEAASGFLNSESLMHGYFHSLGLTSSVVMYMNTKNRDYLITEKVSGEDCTDKNYLSRPGKLCDVLAENLRMLHNRSTEGCPVTDRGDSYVKAVLRGYSSGKYENDLFEGMWEFSSYDEAWKAAKEGMDCIEKNTLIHGDYCLPNIMLDNWQFSGFVDLISAGIADRHIDILWGIWTLKYNLGTDRYTERFIDAYGRELIDINKLRYIAAMEMFGI